MCLKTSCLLRLSRFVFAAPHIVDDGLVETGFVSATFNFTETIGRVQQYMVELVSRESSREEVSINT